MSYQELPTDDQMRDSDDLWGFDVKELFSNDVPHVLGEKVVKPSGMPPSEWTLQ